MSSYDLDESWVFYFREGSGADCGRRRPDAGGSLGPAGLDPVDPPVMASPHVGGLTLHVVDVEPDGFLDLGPDLGRPTVPPLRGPSGRLPPWHRGILPMHIYENVISVVTGEDALPARSVPAREVELVLPFEIVRY